MAKIVKGICKGLPTGCEVGSLYYPEDIDEFDNIRPVELDNGLCIACIEAERDNDEFERANWLDLA